MTRCRLDATGVAVTGAWAETDICGTVVSTVSATRTTSSPVVACTTRSACIALCKDISLQRGRFCARSLASCIPRSSEDRSSWTFFIQVVRGCPGGRLQFSGGGSKTAWLASAFSSVRSRCPEKVRRRNVMMDEGRPACEKPSVVNYCIGAIGRYLHANVYIWKQRNP